MSELDDIVAAAGIVIVDTPAPGDGGDADNKELVNNGTDSRQPAKVSTGSGDTSLPQISTFETLYGHRYTMEDQDYAQTVSEEEFNSRPPCVPDFREKRSRDNFNRNRDGRGRGGGYNRHDNYHRPSYRDREDHHHRGWQSRHRDGGDGDRGYHHRYQDRSHDRSRGRDGYY